MRFSSVIILLALATTASAQTIEIGSDTLFGVNIEGEHASVGVGLDFYWVNDLQTFSGGTLLVEDLVVIEPALTLRAFLDAPGAKRSFLFGRVTRTTAISGPDGNDAWSVLGGFGARVAIHDRVAIGGEAGAGVSIQEGSDGGGGQFNVFLQFGDFAGS